MKLLDTSIQSAQACGATRIVIAQVGKSDIVMPLAEGAIDERAYPHASNHVTNLGGERIANGNAFYFSSGESAQRTIPVA